MKTFFRVLSFARPFGFYIPQYIIYALLSTVFSVVNFTIIIPILKILFNQMDPSEAVAVLPDFSFTVAYFKNTFYYYLFNIIDEKGKISALYYICGILVTSVFLANLFRYLSSMILARVRVNVIKNMRNRAFLAISRFDLGYFTGKRKGDIISRVTTDVQEVELSVVSTFRVLFREPLLIVGYFILMFSMSVQLTLYTLVLIPLSGGVISLIASQLKQRAKRTQESLGRINSTLDEAITGMRIVKAFTATTYILDKFSKEVKYYTKNNFKIAARFNLASPLSEFFGAIVLSALLLIGGHMVLNNNAPLEASEFIGFLVIFSQIVNPAKVISNSMTNISRGLASADRVFQLIDSKPEITEKADAMEITSLENGIEFKDVSFAYEEKLVLKNINLKVNKGEIIALVGPSGGGKSTLADLIPRFYDPVSGAVEIDGKNLRDYKIESVRGLMGIVTQESILFNDTVAANIAFGRPTATEEEIIAAAKIANAHDFISKLPNGYQTEIGERGTKLSGGQRQRLSIARAILKNPPVLIMDEATSALDSESEKLVQDAIYKLMQNRTAIVIAHRLSTIQNANRIFVIQDGEIIESGTHDDLIRRNGLYKKLTEMQSFD